MLSASPAALLSRLWRQRHRHLDAGDEGGRDAAGARLHSHRRRHRHRRVAKDARRDGEAAACRQAEGQLLIIPAIELVDTEKGFTPLIAPQRFVGSLLAAQESLHNKRVEYANFFKRARCERIYSMYHLTLARFLQLNPLPPSVTCVHMAAQFGLCLLPPEDTPTIIEVGTKAVMDLMRDIFAVSGEVAPIGPQGGAECSRQLFTCRRR